MNLFDWLIIGHLVGDFLFQTGWMAGRKAKEWLPLLTHSAVYTVVVALFSFLGGGLSILAILLIFVSHVFLDRKTFVSFWVSRIQTAKGPESKWLSIMTDQIFHIVILALAILLTNVGV